MLARGRSGVLQDDALDDVGDVLAAIGDRLQQLVDLLHLDQLAGIRLEAEELRQARAQHLVGVGLEPVDFAADFRYRFGVRHVIEHLHRGLDFLGAGDADVGQPLGLFGDRPQVVQEHAMRDRKSTRLNSSHVEISYAVFCLKKKKKKKKNLTAKKKKSQPHLLMFTLRPCYTQYISYLILRESHTATCDARPTSVIR